MDDQYRLTQALLASGLDLLPQSIVEYEGILYALAAAPKELQLVAASCSNHNKLSDFYGEHSTLGGCSLVVAPQTPQNATALRNRLPWLQPVTLGLRTSAGMGDRLGLATPGHVRAIRRTGAIIAPVFAQQSMREMTRTGRTPQQVMDDALWGVFQENWQGGFGADADHLKTCSDIDQCLESGYTFFTIDPGEYVDNRAATAGMSELRELAGLLPSEMQIVKTGLLGKTLNIEHLCLSFDEATLYRAAAKYGSAVWHVAQMFHHLEEKAGGRSFELEVSVDETEQPTSHAEHAYIASELLRLGVRWVSLAPRFVGTFEKGVDYIGDLGKFEEDIAGHAAIARFFGPYKLSLHSGSDKFSVYAIAARQTHGLVHLKTAGTSYLEALRTIAGLDAQFFREIYAFARDHYEKDRASYHVSASLNRAPAPKQVTDGTALLDDFDAREILHVTFGSVLKELKADGTPRFKQRLMDLLRAFPEVYAANLEKHFVRHLRLFAEL